jgi:hypothetical protein
MAGGTRAESNADIGYQPTHTHNSLHTHKLLKDQLPLTIVNLDLDVSEAEVHHAFVHVSVRDIMATNVCTVHYLSCNAYHTD